MKTSLRDPIRVDIKRGGLVESRHQISAVLMHPDGTLEECWGDPKMLVFPRSAVKPLQAMALVSSGAVEKFNLTSQEIALACASHGGETMHVEGVRNWLSKVGLQNNRFGMRISLAIPSGIGTQNDCRRGLPPSGA